MHTQPVSGVELEDRPCPNECPANDRLVLEGHDRIQGIPGRYRVVACRCCGLMRTNPRPTAATIGAYYPDEYAPYASTPPPPARQHPIMWRRRLRRWLGLDARQLPPVPPGLMLEIGCASGAYLETMRRCGWRVQGIEFSDTAAAAARAAGLDVQTASVESAVPPAEPVDMITAWMVLEHLHEPIYALKRIRAWVRPQGWLVASIPDAGALARRIFGERAYDLHLPNHLYHYTPRTIATLLHAAGWQLTHVRWQRNCNNLLWSLEYTAGDRGWQRCLCAVRWLRTAPACAQVRLLLGWLLGVTRQSGRIEIWARPASPGDGGQA